MGGTHSVRFRFDIMRQTSGQGTSARRSQNDDTASLRDRSLNWLRVLSEPPEFGCKPQWSGFSAGAGESGKVGCWGARMAGDPAGKDSNAIGSRRFKQLVLPHLSAGGRGPAPKLSFHEIFNYILTNVYLGCQWRSCRSGRLARPA